MAKHQYALKPDPLDLRDKVFRTTQLVNTLPVTVDLRLQMPPIVDQYQLGSCTANAIASGLREYLMIKNNEPHTSLSRLFLYWYERQMEGTLNEDSGAYIRDGMKVLVNIGCCPEVDFPYDISKFTMTPTPQSEANAAAFKIGEYHRVMNTTQLKAALAEGLPVVIGIQVYESFESENVAKNGIVPLPKSGEKNFGGHAVLVVGYKRIGRVLYYIVRNSWGEKWGDKGYFYLPETFFTKGYVTDMWTGH